ncbi:hypothetical protein QQP08_011697 [Theobroma cacao]|nr:hypothetical protein QQP08_011697 [Theobroma cacao]
MELAVACWPLNLFWKEERGWGVGTGADACERGWLTGRIFIFLLVNKKKYIAGKDDLDSQESAACLSVFVNAYRKGQKYWR